jgi:hypothetical protein
MHGLPDRLALHESHLQESFIAWYSSKSSFGNKDVGCGGGEALYAAASVLC